MKNKKDITVKEGKFFSFALFKQSFKSQKNIWLITTLGNALVIGIIIIILSTLTINTTKTGLGNLFDTASLEHTVKSSASQAYMSYELITDNYYNDLDTLSTVAGTNALTLSGYDTIVNETVANTGVSYGQTMYGTYEVFRAQGADKETARESTKRAVKDVLKAAGKDETTRNVVVNYFVDPYLKAYDPDEGDKVTDVSTLYITAFPEALSNYIKTEMPTYADYALVLSNVAQAEINDYVPGNDVSKRKKLINSYTTQLVAMTGADIDNDTLSSALNVIINGTTDSLKIKSDDETATIAGCGDDAGAFSENKNYLKSYAIIEASLPVSEKLIKWEYFPTFEVGYVTNDAGVPVDKDGKEIFDYNTYCYLSDDYVPCDVNGNELVINDELLAKRVPIKEKMGTNADNMQKKYSALLQPRKVEQLNGKTKDDFESENDKNQVKSKYVGYTAEEINKAKDDLNNSALFSQAKVMLADFCKKTIEDDKNNTHTYYDKNTKTINENNIIAAVSSYLKTAAVETIKEQFNIESIDELTKENNGISGEEMLEKVDTYTVSAIATFNSVVAKYQAIEKTDYNTGEAITENGEKVAKYSLFTCQEMAIVKSGLGITDQLPTYLKTALTEMADMNTYGLIVGLIFFDCAGLLLPIIYLMMSANDLIAGQVDSGSLAFVLSTPTKRSKFTFTQVVYLFGSLTVSFAFFFLVALSIRHIGIAMGSTDLVTDLTDLQLLYYSIGGYAVCFALAGICFLSSCIFNKSKMSLGCGMGVSMFFLVISIIGIFGMDTMPSVIRIEAMNYFNYVTIVRLFDVNAVLTNDMLTYGLKLIALFGIGAATTIGGCIYFEKKDLPL